MRNEIRAINYMNKFILPLITLGLFFSLPVFAENLDEWFAGTVSASYASIVDIFYITGTSTLSNLDATITAPTLFTGGYTHNFACQEFNPDKTKGDSSGYGSGSDSYTGSGYSWKLNADGKTKAQNAILNAVLNGANHYHACSYYADTGAIWYAVYYWDGTQITLPPEYNVSTSFPDFPDEFFIESNQEYIDITIDQAGDIFVNQEVVDVICPTYNSVFRCGVRESPGSSGGWSATGTCGWLFDKTSKFREDCLKMDVSTDDDYYYYVAEEVIQSTSTMYFKWKEAWYCNDTFYNINMCEEDIDWDYILNQDRLDYNYSWLPYSNFTEAGIFQINGEIGTTTIDDFSIYIAGVHKSSGYTHSYISVWTNWDVEEATGTLSVNENFDVLLFGSLPDGSQDQMGHGYDSVIWRFARFQDGPYYPQILKIQGTICRSDGTTCFDPQSYLVYMVTSTVEVWPIKTWDEALEDTPVKDLQRRLGDQSIMDRMARWVSDLASEWFYKIVDRFPFSWMYGTYDIFNSVIDSYDGETGTSSAVGFTIGWTMPTSSVVMAGEEFTVVNFEEASAIWGEYFAIFRTILIFVIYLTLLMVIFKKSSRFLKNLGEED